MTTNRLIVNIFLGRSYFQTRLVPFGNLSKGLGGVHPKPPQGPIVCTHLIQVISHEVGLDI